METTPFWANGFKSARRSATLLSHMLIAVSHSVSHAALSHMLVTRFVRLLLRPAVGGWRCQSLPRLHPTGFWCVCVCVPVRGSPSHHPTFYLCHYNNKVCVGCSHTHTHTHTHTHNTHFIVTHTQHPRFPSRTELDASVGCDPPKRLVDSWHDS
jgi:hypothetical protein